MISSSPLRLKATSKANHYDTPPESLVLSKISFPCALISALDTINKHVENIDNFECLASNNTRSLAFLRFKELEADLEIAALRSPDKDAVIQLLSDASILSATNYVRRSAFGILQQLDPSRSMNLYQLHRSVCAIWDIAHQAGTIPAENDYINVAAIVKPLLNDKLAVTYLCKYITLSLWGDKLIAEPLSETRFRDLIEDLIQPYISNADRNPNAMFLGLEDRSFAFEALNASNPKERQFLKDIIVSSVGNVSNYEIAAIRSLSKVSGDKVLGDWLYQALFAFPNETQSPLNGRLRYLAAKGIANNMSAQLADELTNFLHLDTSNTSKFIIAKEFATIKSLDIKRDIAAYIANKFIGFLPLLLGGGSRRERALRTDTKRSDLSDYRICAAIALEDINPKVATDILLYETNGGDSWKAKGTWFLHNDAIEALKRLGKIPSNESDFQRSIRDATGHHFEEEELRQWLDSLFNKESDF